MMAPNLPQIRVADIDLLSEWDLSENVRALGDSIPGYRSSASKYKTQDILPSVPYSMHFSVLTSSPLPAPTILLQSMPYSPYTLHVLTDSIGTQRS